MIDICFDIFSMIFEKFERIEVKRNVNCSKLALVNWDWDEKLKWEKVLINFLIVLRKDKEFNAQSKDQILVKFFEIDLIILLTITITAFFINFDAISLK